MIRNEKGNSLLTVMLVSLLLTTLGLSLIASTIGSTKRVETRETDVEKTYEGITLVDNMIAKLSTKLQTVPLTKFNKNQIDSLFDTKLQSILIDDLITPNQTQPFVECLNIIDLSGRTAKFVGSMDGSACVNLSDYKAEDIETTKDFTRVFEIVLVTKNPQEYEGQFKRTIRKKVILSPLPSFLKYAVGSVSDDSNGGLYLNGSPNIVGNLYTNRLAIKDQAEFIDANNNAKTMNTLYPSVHGDIYSSSSSVLDVLKKENFYNQKLPTLKHDSQFINIKFDETFEEQATESLKNNFNVSYRTNLTDSIVGHAEEIVQTKLAEPEQLNDLFVLVDNQENPVHSAAQVLNESYKLESTGNKLVLNEDYHIPKDLVITSIQEPITINGDLVVDGDLYLVANKDITITSNLYVSGNIYFIGLKGNITLGNPSLLNTSAYALNNIYIVNENEAITNDYYAKLVAANSLYVENKQATLHFYENILAGKEAKLTSSNSKNVTVEADMIVGNNVYLTSRQGTMEIKSNILTAGSFYLKGDSTDAAKEDDIFTFDSVVFAQKQGYISNVNILGAENNQKQLILLAKEKLTITRMNEFNNFAKSKEQDGLLAPEDTTIKPLKAFFYTDSEAELYGVGSLFYINGGIFAKEKLVINSVRGEVDSVNDLNGVLNRQQDYYSRFNVVYNKKVLLGRINALPIVEYLQVVPDDLIVE